MQTFQQRVLDRIGEALNGSTVALSDAMIDDFCTEGSQDLVGKLPNALVLPLAQTMSAMSNPIQVPTTRIVGVYREVGAGQVRTCRQIAMALRDAILDANSIHYATKLTPRYVQLPTQILVAPAPTADPDDAALVEYIEAPTIDSDTDVAIQGLPEALEHCIVLYAVWQGLQREGTQTRRRMLTQLATLTDPVTGQLAAFRTAVPTLSLPDDTNTYAVLDLTTWLDATSLSVPEPLIAHLQATDALDNPLVEMTTVPGTLPSVDTSTLDFTWTGTTVTDALTKAEQLIDTTAGINVEATLAGHDIALAEGAIRTAAQEVTRAQSAIQDQLGQIQAAEAELQQQVRQFQADAEAYRVGLEHDVQRTQNILQGSIAQAQLDQQTWQAQLNAIIQAWQTNEVEFKYSRWRHAVGDALQQFQADLTAARTHLEELQAALQTVQVDGQTAQLATAQAGHYRQQYHDTIAAYLQARGYGGDG